MLIGDIIFLLFINVTSFMINGFINIPYLFLYNLLGL